MSEGHHLIDPKHLTEEEREAVTLHLGGDESPEVWARVEAAMERIVSENLDDMIEAYNERQLNLVFRDCPECGHSIGCKLEDDGTVNTPDGCKDHT